MSQTGIEPASQAASPFDIERVRSEFPALRQQVHGRALAYLDNAATSHKPQAVIDAVCDFYAHRNANVYRGLHTLSDRATVDYQAAREKVARFLHVDDARQIVLTRGTTEAINLVAHAARHQLAPGDEVLITHMEHHANIVPWQVACEATGATLRVAPITDTGEVDLDAFDGFISEKTKLVAVTHVSNVLGTINPVRQITAMAHEVGAMVLVDGAQAMPHLRVDVGEIDCDFYAFSGHKCFGPTGIGVLFGRFELLDAMPPYQTGGEMIESVTLADTSFAAPPMRFEAGTPNIAGAIGLGVAVDYLARLDRQAARHHECDLLAYATAALRELPGLRIIGEAERKSPILSFVIDGIHPYDAAPVLDRCGVAVRTGHHCAQPLMDRLGVRATMRASLAMYNTRAEIDALIAGLARARELLQ